MRDAGKIAAAIEILGDFEVRKVPLKTALADWARANRYAGAKDRAWISGLCLDALRKRNSLSAAMGDESARALALGAVRFLWGRPVDDVAALAAEEPHGAGALTDAERQKLLPLAAATAEANSAAEPDAGVRRNQPLSIIGDFPDWLEPSVKRVFGADAAVEMAAFAERADVDLRLNTLKVEPEKALAALKTVKAEAVPMLATAARIAAPDPAERAPAVTIIPAFNKGWVEVQDLGSQFAALAAGDIKGAQVLDYCAGGGGKTLALAALMENTGQLYAYDRDARRLKPLYERARRAGVRNLQIVNPSTDNVALEGLKRKMDVVFVDAPCTGAGTWRRRPDTKWRLTPQQLELRMAEQDAVLREACAFVKPGGVMVYVTCSFLMEENEDRLAVFLGEHPDFAFERVRDRIEATGLVADEGHAAVAQCETAEGALRFTPARMRADGFFVCVLRRGA